MTAQVKPLAEVTEEAIRVLIQEGGKLILHLKWARLQPTKGDGKPGYPS